MDPFFHAGLKDIAGRYDGFILDLWGVVHDGQAPYPGAVATLRRLRELGKRVLLLSNAPRPSGIVSSFLADMGVDERCYDFLVTSGDLVRAVLESGDGLPGRRCLMIGSDRDHGLLDGLDYTLAASPDAADFVLCCGLRDDEKEKLDGYLPLLRAAQACALPMICANPDLTVMRGRRLVLCAGTLAAAFEEMGGRVRYYGKPHAAAYEACFKRLDLPQGRVLAIGDSLRTDVAGAIAAGIAVLLIPGGIHAEEWGLMPGELPQAAAIEVAFAAAGLRPSGVLAGLRW